MRSLWAIVVLASIIGCKDMSGSKAKEGDTPAVIERWTGGIEQPPDLPIAFELRVTMSTPPTAQLQIPGLGLALTDLTEVVYGAEEIRFTLALPGRKESAHARFVLTRTGDRATGTLTQNKKERPITMRRLADGEEFAAGPVRSQTPMPPFPYDEREASFASADGTRLAGTLTLPRGATATPAIVLISGSGAQDRDETLFGHKPFWVLADQLTRAGVAVLRVDDRGVGGSAGDTTATPLDGKVDDALAAITWLEAQPEIARDRIGLLGHSEGGVVAAMTAVRRPVAFLVLIGTPGIPGGELSVVQIEAMMRAQGATEAQIATRAEGQRRLVELALSGADAGAIRAAVTEAVDAMIAAGGAAVPESARQAAIDQATAGLLAPDARSLLAADPAKALAQVSAPVLALAGSLDRQVPADIDADAIRAALAGNADATVEVLPGLNHLLQPARTGAFDEYAHIDVTIEPKALTRIVEWVKTRATRAR